MFIIIIIRRRRNGAKTMSPNFVWGLNNNKKRCKNNKSPNFVWELNKKQSKHNMSPETSFGGHNQDLAYILNRVGRIF
jgi:hypothetical protein